MAVGRSHPGLFFETSNLTVRLLFVLGTLRSDPASYLRLVGTLCRLLRDPAVSDALFWASGPGTFAAVLPKN